MYQTEDIGLVLTNAVQEEHSYPLNRFMRLTIPEMKKYSFNDLTDWRNKSFIEKTDKLPLINTDQDRQKQIELKCRFLGSYKNTMQHINTSLFHSCLLAKNYKLDIKSTLNIQTHSKLLSHNLRRSMVKNHLSLKKNKINDRHQRHNTATNIIFKIPIEENKNQSRQNFFRNIHNQNVGRVKYRKRTVIKNQHLKISKLQ